MILIKIKITIKKFGKASKFAKPLPSQSVKSVAENHFAMASPAPNRIRTFHGILSADSHEISFLSFTPEGNALYGVAKSLQDLEKYDEALVEYRKIEELEPSFYVTYFNQGYIKHHYQNQLDSAEYFYEKVVQRNPEYIGAWYQLGEVYYQQKRYTKAANSYAEALHIDEDFEPAKQAAEKLRNIKVK